MLNNVLVQRGQVCVNMFANLVSILIDKLAPGALKSVWLFGGYLLVTEIHRATFVAKGINDMMLSTRDTREHSGTKTTLVGNNKEVEHVPLVVAWHF